MTDHSSHTGKYIGVFVALMVLTGITVGISFLHFGIAAAVVAALIVASIKGGLVASFFMHLIGENKWIYLVLVITAFFFLILLAIPTIVTVSDYRL